MDALLKQTAISLRLHYRNRMALLYSYLFPIIFLLAFYVLYRHESVVLARHMGELLTVGILGGACFGLPTTMVSERERGVWRRYRLAPVPTAALVSSTIAARYAILVTAGLLQLALALALGMPFPRHPAHLLLAFTFVSFAFIGLGLVMATLADNVPAVQALGQCIFLPMLIIGGIAVPLASLPDWAQHVSAFFPGRYAVQAVQACVAGAGLRAVGFDLLALTIIGAAGCIAGAMMFRWDAQQRFAARRHKAWIVVPVAAWVAVGVMSEMDDRVATTAAVDRTLARSSLPAAPSPVIRRPAPPATTKAPEALPPARVEAPKPAPIAPDASAPRGKPTESGAPPTAAGPPRPENKPLSGTSAARGSSRGEDVARGNSGRGNVAGSDAGRGDAARGATARDQKSGSNASQAPAAPPVQQPIAPTWQAVKPADIDRDLIFDRLPPDDGIVAPIAPASEEPPPEVLQQLDAISAGLPGWAPAKAPDAVQRARNILYIAAVPDVLQTELERFAPAVVFYELQQDFPKADLMKVLYWIALHPMEGDDSAIEQLPALGFESRAVDVEQTRERVALYAVKLLGRLTGAIHPK
jgi:ABC-type transport system involved in cytochrome c biogenesis permease component